MRDTYVNASGIIFLGRQGEDKANVVHFPLALFKDCPAGGTFSLYHKRQSDDNAYPCVITENDESVLWEIGSADVAIPGNGSAQLSYYVGETLSKSVIFRTQCSASLEEGEDVPEPYQAWVDEVAEYAARAEAAVSHYPYIGENANWYVWDGDEFVDTGVRAEGIDGQDGQDGRDGEDGEDGQDGADGEDGVSVVSVYIDASHHLICELSDGTTIDAGEIQGGGGTGDHTELSNRDAANQHPMSAITGLEEALLQKYTKPQTGIPSSDLASAAQSSLGKADTAVQPSALSAYRTSAAQDVIDDAQDAAINAKYTKPSGGIPASDLASGVIPETEEAVGVDIVTSVSSASTDAQVPTAKAVYDALSSVGGAIITEEGSSDNATLHNNETVLFNGSQAAIYAYLDTPESGTDFITGCIFKAQSGQYFEDVAPNGYSVVWGDVPTWTEGKVYEIIYRCLWIEDGDGNVIISAKWSEV